MTLNFEQRRVKGNNLDISAEQQSEIEQLVFGLDSMLQTLSQALAEVSDVEQNELSEFQNQVANFLKNPKKMSSYNRNLGLLKKKDEGAVFTKIN